MKAVASRGPGRGFGLEKAEGSGRRTVEGLLATEQSLADPLNIAGESGGGSTVIIELPRTRSRQKRRRRSRSSSRSRSRRSRSRGRRRRRSSRSREKRSRSAAVALAEENIASTAPPPPKGGLGLFDMIQKPPDMVEAKPENHAAAGMGSAPPPAMPPGMSSLQPGLTYGQHGPSGVVGIPGAALQRDVRRPMPGGAKVCVKFLTSVCFETQCPFRHPTNEHEVGKWFMFFHQTPCRYGTQCRTPNCLYQHPNRASLVPQFYVNMPPSSHGEQPLINGPGALGVSAHPAKKVNGTAL